MKTTFTILLIAISITFPFQDCISQTIIASYPLDSTLADTTGNYDDIELSETDFPSGALCVDGNYPNGCITPALSAFNKYSFQLDVDFILRSYGIFTHPVIVGGRSGRWIGVLHDDSGNLHLLYNNSNTILTEGSVALDEWYKLKIQYDNQHVRLLLNEIIILDECIPELEISTPFYYRFTTSNYSNGTALHGCIKNLIITNDPIVPPFETNETFVNINTGDSVTVGENIYKTTGIYTDTLKTLMGCDSVVITNLTVISGTYELQNGDKLKIYPNPTKGTIKVDLGRVLKEVEYNVRNLEGKAVMTQKFRNVNEFKLELKGEKGIYLITITTNEDETFTFKAIKN